MASEGFMGFGVTTMVSHWPTSKMGDFPDVLPVHSSRSTGSKSMKTEAFREVLQAVPRMLSAAGVLGYHENARTNLQS